MAQSNVGDLVVSLDVDSVRFSNQMAAARSQLGGFGTDAESATNYLETMKRSALGLTGILAGGLTATSLIKTADEWGQLSSRMAMATGSASELEEAQRRLMEISDRTYKPIEEQAELFIRNASAMRELGYSTSEAIDYIDSISSSLTINAASSQRAESAINALSKATVAGKVSGKNWNTILGVMPTIAGDIARHLGTTETAVKQLAASGKLSFKDFSDAVIAAREENARLAEKMPTTVGDAITRLSNHWKAYVGDANAATGATATLASGINLLTENLDTIVTLGEALAVGMLSKYFLSASAAAITASKSFLTTRASAISLAQAQLQAAQTVQYKATIERRAAEAAASYAAAGKAQRETSLALVAARGREAAAINAVTAAQTRLNTVSSAGRAIGSGLLGLFGGPVGMIATVASVAAGFLLMRDNSSEANQVLQDMSGPVDSLVEKFRALDDVNQKAFVDNLKRDMSNADAELRTAEAAFERFAQSMATTLIYAGPGVAPIEIIDTEQQGALDAFLGTLREIKGSAGGISDLSGYLQSSLNAFVDSANATKAQKEQLQNLAVEYVNGRLKVEDFTRKLREITSVSNEAATAQRNLANAINVDFSKQITSATLALDVSAVAATGAAKEADLLRSAYAAAGEQAEELAPVIRDLVAARGNLDVAPEYEGLKTWIQLQAKIQDNNEAARQFNQTVKSGDKETKQLEDSFNRMLSSQKQQIALYGETSSLAKLQYELSFGELSVLSESQKVALIRNATELDRLAATERYKSLTDDLRTNEEKALDTARERVKILNDANVSAEEYAQIMERISKDMLVEAPKFSGIDSSISGAAGELFKVAEAERDLQDWYSKQLEMLAEFYSEKEGMEQEHADKIAQINTQLAQRQEQIQYASTKSMLSVMGDFTSGSVELLSAMGEESSGIYKAMFLANKAVAVANAIISAHVAAAKARELGPQYGGEALATTTLAMGYANAAIIASTALAGMAHDGIDYVPNEGTWLLAKGERVVDSRTNEDLKSFLSAGGSTGGASDSVPEITQIFNLYGNGDDALAEVVEEAAMKGAALARQEMLTDFQNRGPARRLLDV